MAAYAELQRDRHVDRQIFTDTFSEVIKANKI